MWSPTFKFWGGSQVPGPAVLVPLLVKFHGTNKFPAVKYSIVGNYSSQKAQLQDNRI